MFLAHNDWLLKLSLSRGLLLYCHTTKYNCLYHLAAFAKYQKPTVGVVLRMGEFCWYDGDVGEVLPCRNEYARHQAEDY